MSESFYAQLLVAWHPNEGEIDAILHPDGNLRLALPFVESVSNSDEESSVSRTARISSGAEQAGAPLRGTTGVELPVQELGLVDGR